MPLLRLRGRGTQKNRSRRKRNAGDRGDGQSDSRRDPTAGGGASASLMENQTTTQPAGEQGVNGTDGDDAGGGAGGEDATIYNPANPSILMESQLREIDPQLQPDLSSTEE